LYVRIPSVVHVCRKVSGKSPAFEIYVPLPPAKTPGKGNIIMLNSLKGLAQDLCYSVADLAMFVPEADLEGVDIVKKWHDNTKSRVTDLDEATARLSQYVIGRGDEEVDVDVYGPATDSRKQEQEAQVQEQGAQVRREEARRGAGGTQVRTVAQESAFTMAHVELASEEEQSVSAATLSGAPQAASHPNVAHFTDTLVRMDYLQDFQNGVYLLLDPLGTELMGRCNKVAKHIKSKVDAEEAMLVLCREGKMEFLNEQWTVHDTSF
jgi:hypothetical protein